jgi:hypothetical protein
MCIYIAYNLQNQIRNTLRETKTRNPTYKAQIDTIHIAIYLFFCLYILNLVMKVLRNVNTHLVNTHRFVSNLFGIYKIEFCEVVSWYHVKYGITRYFLRPPLRRSQSCLWIEPYVSMPPNKFSEMWISLWCLASTMATGDVSLHERNNSSCNTIICRLLRCKHATVPNGPRCQQKQIA